MEPLLWLIVLAVLLIIEAITVGLTTIWFAGGALIAAVLSWMGINDIEWMARTVSDEELIPANTVVEIEAVRGVKLIVKKQNISEEKEVK